jgi:hypothetical protein
VARWDPREIRILVRAGADPRLALAGVAAVLADVGAHRTWSGFQCYCGEPIRLPSELAEHTGCPLNGTPSGAKPTSWAQR